MRQLNTDEYYRCITPGYTNPYKECIYSSKIEKEIAVKINFLYKEILEQPFGQMDHITWAKKPKRLPVVLSKQETRNLLRKMDGIYRLMAEILYGSGLRLMECIRLRIKDIDFQMNQIRVWDGKGHISFNRSSKRLGIPGLLM